MKTLAIIGTAGRKDDAAKLASIPRAFAKMCDVAKGFINQQCLDPGIEIRLISGGAAWADHIAIALFNEGFVKHLTLAIPTAFVQGRFTDNGQFYQNPGGTINCYHERFTKVAFPKNTDISSLRQIATAIEKGAIIAIGNGLFQRNAIIARQADILLALTFGNKNVLKAGGTSHALGKFLQIKPAAAAHHCDLHTFKIWTHATSEKIENPT